MDKETYKKLEHDFTEMCTQYNECYECPYNIKYWHCQLMWAYDKGYVQAKRDMDTRTDIQRFRVSGHP